MSGSVHIEVTDPSTGDANEADIQAGDYCLTVVEPCYVAHIQQYGNGTVVLTLRNHLPSNRSEE